MAVEIGSERVSEVPESARGVGVPLAESEFKRASAMIRDYAGIALLPTKRTMVHSRLSRRLAATGIPSFTAYMDHVEQSSGERQEFINALTTNLTSFFREGYHFPVLTDYLKELGGRGKPVRIWCAASSTGEEPWSLAMTAASALGARANWSLIATDIDTNVLAKARAGVYPMDSVEGIPMEHRRAFLMKGTGRNAGTFRIRPDLGKHVTFQQFNLMTPKWDFGEPFDVVFCRNVLIYFDGPTKNEIMTRMHAVLKPSTLVFIGHSETLNDLSTLFKLEGRTIYRRLDRSGA